MALHLLSWHSDSVGSTGNNAFSAEMGIGSEFLKLCHIDQLMEPRKGKSIKIVFDNGPFH